MEESFNARVDKVFGSLAAAQNAQRVDASLWSLTEQEIERQEWNRGKKTPPELDEQRLTVSSIRPGVLDEEEDDDDADDYAAVPSSRMNPKPDDHDEEEWMIRSSVGMDSTLDKEDEEDEFDKIAVGIDKAVDGINEYDNGSDDDEAIGVFGVDAFGIGAVVPFGKSSDSLSDDRVGVKSILKKDERKSENSLKRVRFDPESACGLELEKDVDRSVRFASGADVEGEVTFPTPRTDPRVPDYLRNPSKYTVYTLDSTGEINDEEANKKAYMDFFNLIREKHTKELQPSEDMIADISKPITFTPRKKTIDDDSMNTSDPLKKGPQKEYIQSKVVSAFVIAAADEACAMEEDEIEATVVCSSISKKTQRQYRAKATLEQKTQRQYRAKATLEPLGN